MVSAAEKAARAPMRIRRLLLTDSPVCRPGATLPVWTHGWQTTCRWCVWWSTWDSWSFAMDEGLRHLLAAHKPKGDRDAEGSQLAVQR